MAFKLYNLLAIASLAVIASDFVITPTAALSSGNSVRNIRPHDAIAKRKRSSVRRCKPRPASSSAAAPAAASSAAPAESSSSSTSSSAYTGGKLGFAFPNGPDDLTHYQGNGKTFLYNWAVEGPSNAAERGFSFAPMLWGPSKIGNWHDVVGNGNYEILLGPNEVNEEGQANMDVSSGLGLWYDHFKQYESNHQMWSPSVSSRPNGLQWLKDFVAGCNGCKIDCITVHWYDTTVDKLKTYLGDFHTAFPDKGICLTEFAFQNFNGDVQPSDDQIHAYMAEAQSWMNQQDWIKVYTPFGFMRDMVNVNIANQLMDPSTGGPNAFGSTVMAAA